jgi:predicted nucleic acid-binding Zn ribbon protein
LPTCVQCGQGFTPWKRGQTICSEECRLARKRDYEVRYWAAR